MRQQELLKGAAGRMRNFRLSRAWNKWHEFYMQIKDQQFKMMGALNRMKHLKLSQAWEQWQVSLYDVHRLWW